jgi:hypothetical protein
LHLSSSSLHLLATHDQNFILKEIVSKNHHTNCGKSNIANITKRPRVFVMTFLGSWAKMTKFPWMLENKNQKKLLHYFCKGYIRNNWSDSILPPSQTLGREILAYIASKKLRINKCHMSLSTSISLEIVLKIFSNNYFYLTKPSHRINFLFGYKNLRKHPKESNLPFWMQLLVFGPELENFN